MNVLSLRYSIVATVAVAAVACHVQVSLAANATQFAPHRAVYEISLAKAVAGLKTRTNADVDGVRADVSLKAVLQAAADATVALKYRVRVTY